MYVFDSLHKPADICFNETMSYFYTHGSLGNQQLDWLIDCCLISSLPRSISAIVMTGTIRHLGKKIGTTGATSETWTNFPSRTSDFTPSFYEVSVAQYLVFCVVLCRSLFVLLSFFFWPLYFLSFNILLLITPLISSNIS